MLPNAKHEIFAQALAVGQTQKEAYLKAFGKYSPTNACTLAKHPDIKTRIIQIREKAEKKTILTLQEKREFLAGIVRTPVGEIDDKSPLCQSVKVSMMGTEYKMPDKIRAIELDSKLSGDLKDTPPVIASGVVKPIVVVIPNVIAEPRPLRERKTIDI